MTEPSPVNAFFAPYFAPAAKIIAESTSVTFDDALGILRQSHNAVKQFCDEYERRILSARARLCGELMKSHASVLSQETHHAGESIYKIEGKDALVAYSSQRAHPHVFEAAVDFICEQLGVANCSRATASPSASNALRQFIRNTGIKDVRAASYHSGIVLACAQLIALTDAHVDNVVFENSRPIVIDDECVLQPVRQSQLDLLEGDRREAISGFVRSLLLPSRTMSADACGFSMLLKAGPDIKAFEAGYFGASSAVSGRLSSFLDCISCATSRDPWARYLVRSTHFYSICKQVAGAIIVSDGERVKSIKDAVFDCFAYEATHFPELTGFVDDEIVNLLRGDTPYYLVNLLSGDVTERRSGSTRLQLSPPIEWFRARLSYCIDHVVRRGRSEIHAALAPWVLQ